MDDNYPKAYKEIFEILKYIPKKELNKIPIDFLNMIKIKMDTKYNFQIDKNKTFENQTLLQETREILALLYKDYWADDYQKKVIENKWYNDLKNIND